MSVGKDGSSLADALRSDQRQRWLAGERVLVEQYVDEHPELRSDPDALFEVISGEFHLREELGEFPDVSEYAIRFPELIDRLPRLASGTEPDDSEARNRSTRPTAPQPPAGLHCRCCGRISRPADIGTPGEVCCEHCGKVLLIVEETAPYEMTTVAVVGRFELREHVGSGQFGDVWRAFDADLRREVAIKIPRRMPEGKSMQALFVREARAAARLKHPHIVPIYEVGRDKGRVYIVSGYIRGTTLKDFVAQRRVAPREAAELCATIARALHHAHQEGIVHRDLKPGNILMDQEGRPHIADFGLAKYTSEDATLTVEGQVIGTPAYMSPEQARGEAHQADRRSDIYSLGVILYELLAGRRPFESKGDVLTYEILNIDAPSPRKLNRTVPQDLETICLKAMAKEASARYATAEEVAADLDRFLAGEPILAKRASIVRRAWRWSRRKRVQIASACALAGAVWLTAGSMLANRRDLVLPAVEPRRVLLETEPAGAELYLIPLQPITAEPQPDQIIHADDLSPIQLDLVPGDYLVVAILKGHGFHEVQRHVPSKEETVPYSYNHRFWKLLPNGVVQLPKVKIPDESITDGMAFLEGTERFVMGETHPDNRVLAAFGSPTPYRLPSFYMDPREFTVGEFRNLANGQTPSQMRDAPPPDNAPLWGEDCNSAMHLAEKSGKRLMTEVEYEYAATARGTRRFPWGNEFPDNLPPVQDFFVNEDTFDHLDTNPPVLGLCSGLAEWTTSRPTMFDPSNDDRWKRRIVRGGAAVNAYGDPAVDADLRNPRMKVPSLYAARHRGLGFRCVRSAKPRLGPEDFISAVTAPAGHASQ